MMKKTILFIFLCIMLIGITSCNKGNVAENGNFIDGKDGAVGTFSYNGYLKQLERAGGLKKDPSEFVNTTETEVKTKDKAIELAKNELTEEKYRQINVYYDKTTHMWAIDFSMSDYYHYTAGGGQMIFIDSKGITKLVTYGE